MAEAATKSSPLVTPDGRYIVVRGRLWRRMHPGLSDADRDLLIKRLMNARRTIGRIGSAGNQKSLEQARAEVDAAKIALGERGPVWWHDGAPDLNRHMARNTPYAAWYAVHGEA